MTIKQQLNGDTTSWILRAVVLLALGWFFREGAYIRDRLAVVEVRQQSAAGQLFTRAEGRELRGALLELERLVQTKADARELRSELIRWQEILNERIREMETRRIP